MVWSRTPERLRNNPHFKKRLQIIDRISMGTALIAATLAVALSWYLGENAWIVTVYAVLPTFAALMGANFVAWIVRLRVIGFLPTDVSRLIPLGARHSARTWMIMRLGLFVAMIASIVAFVIALIVGLGSQLFFWTTAYIVFGSMIGTGVLGLVMNVAMVAHRKRAPKNAGPAAIADI
jgi:hypothetical protein